MSLNHEKKGVAHDSEGDNPLGLREADMAVLDAQVDIPQTDAGYKAIYRFATKVDFVVMVLSSISAAAAGTSLPLMTVCFPSSHVQTWCENEHQIVVLPTDRDVRSFSAL